MRKAKEKEGDMSYSRGIDECTSYNSPPKRRILLKSMNHHHRTTMHYYTGSRKERSGGYFSGVTVALIFQLFSSKMMMKKLKTIKNLF